MTTETQEPQTSDETPTPAEVDAGSAAEVPALAATGPRTRPLVDRYLTPLVLPIVVVGGLLFYVLNVSRVFIASAGAGAVTAAVVMTLAILIGGSALSNSPRLRTSSIVLVLVGCFAVIGMAGWLTAGPASPHDEVEATFEPVVQEATVVSGNFFFQNLDPTEVPVGVTRLTVDNEAGAHTFVISDAAVRIEGGKGNMSAPGEFTFGIDFGEPGTYTFYCDIPGHRASGMEGEITVDESLPAEPIDGSGGEGGETEPAP